jgi:hypothetical protein
VWKVDRKEITMSKTERICRDCHWRNEKQECKCFPPQAALFDEQKLVRLDGEIVVQTTQRRVAFWPPVPDHESCGQWRKREDEQ